MVELLTRMREIEQLLANQAPFDEAVAKIDEGLALPGSDEYRASIEHYRVSAYVMHGRPVDECTAVIDAYIAIQPALVARAQAILTACGTRPELAPRYLDAMIGELEQAAPADHGAENALQDAYRLRRRLRGERPMVIAERVLTVDGEPGRTVMVTIYAPTPDRESGKDWMCEFRVQGALAVQDRAHGPDALQALIHAIRGVTKTLDESGLSLTWAGGEPGDHGVLGIVPRLPGREGDRQVAAHELPRTYKFVLRYLKEPDTWAELSDQLDIPYDVFKRHFEYGDYADIELRIDKDLRVVGGRVLPIGWVHED